MAVTLRWYDLAMSRRLASSLLLTALLTACRAAGPTPTDPGLGDADFGRARWLDAASTGDPAIPELEAYRRRTAEALKAEPPVLRLEGELSAEQRRAQELALADPRLAGTLRDSQSGQALRTEVFGIYPLRDGDLGPATEACRGGDCYRVELYNFALNLSQSLVVDLAAGAVIQHSSLPGSAPDLPPPLARLAAAIAAASPELAQALGRQPEADEALMSATKTALNQSRCERSQHLCVAPTFVEGDGALWAIVDLTEGRLAGLRWTRVGSTGPVTEKRIQNEVMMREVCDKPQALERDGWTLSYSLTRSDGLKVADLSFQGRPVLQSAKLVDWHVSYSDQEGFGYSDAVGCPEFSQAAVVAIEPPKVLDLVEDGQVVGFKLVQGYWNELWPLPCNYSYEQSFLFFRDGRFRPLATSLGRGCGDTGTYRPVLRLAFPAALAFSQWDGAAWQPWDKEGWQAQAKAAVDGEGAMLRAIDETGRGWRIAPGAGTPGDDNVGDDALLYLTRQHPDREEGEADLVTLGPCCNTDYRQGPEKFFEPQAEALAGAPAVLWYVAQLANDDRPGQEYCWAEQVLEEGRYVAKSYPCHAGPLFLPVSP